MKNDEKIIELGTEINKVARDYDYPESPSVLFLYILSSFVATEDSSEVLSSIQLPTEQFLYQTEMEYLIDWLNRMWKLCQSDDDVQLLYDTIVNQEEE